MTALVLNPNLQDSWSRRVRTHQIVKSQTPHNFTQTIDPETVYNSGKQTAYVHC